MTETWYVLDDGGFADPSAVVTGEDGKLKHKDGRKVSYAPHGPRTRSVDADAERKKAEPLDPDGNKPSRGVPSLGRDMKPVAPKRGYTTRQSKAD